MTAYLSAVLALAWLALAWISPGPGAPRAVPDPSSAPPLDRAARTRVLETIARQPLRFEANAGQFAADVRYAARGVGYGVALTPTGATLTLIAGDRAADVEMRLIDRDGRPAM